MELGGMNLWIWIGFYILVLIMLAIDLFSFGKKGQHEVGIKESLRMTVVWIGVSVLFGLGVFIFDADPQHPGELFQGKQRALEYFAGYLIEKSLSMDNLFVFLMLFSYFGVERKYQHEVLFWGIFGALVLRSIFIFAGVAVITRFEWVLAIFGVFLLYTGAKMFSGMGDDVDPSKNVIVKVFKKFFPVTTQRDGGNFFTKINGKTFATPLFIALIVIETTDVAFAVDSIPAVFSVSHDPFVVLTSNIFALLGLRALYFALSAIADYFRFLKYGLGVILIFVGIKMIIGLSYTGDLLREHLGCDIPVGEGIEVPIALSLGIIIGVLAISILASVVIKDKSKQQ